MHKARLQRLITPYYQCSVEPEGDPAGGGGGGGGDEPPAKDDVDKGKGAGQPDIDKIVKGRVEETRRSTREQVAKELGVSLDEAKKLIEAANAAADAEKSEATKAREAADREKAESEKEKAEAAKERHDAKVERLLIRALPKDLEDDVLDKKVTRLGRLLDVEVGSDVDAIKTAIDELKKDDPTLFGAVAASEEQEKPGTKPPGDPKGTPPKQQGQTTAVERGRERAKGRAPRQQYAFETTTGK